MTVQSSAPSGLDDLIRRRRPGFSLEQPFYLSPAIFDHDMDRVYRRHWLFAGHVSRVPKPGDYFLYQVGGESIIILRGRDGGIHALFNVCRHRGSRICGEAEGHVSQLVCPYHAWTYGLDGALLAARHFPDDLDRAEYALQRGQVREVEGLIFISLAAEPPDFERVAADIERFFKPHRLPAARICARHAYLTRANWKIVVENFSECYHCGPAHPELCSVMSYVRAYDSKRLAEERAAYIERWTEATRRLGHLVGEVRSSEGVQHEVIRIPIREGFLTESRDGRPVAPLMGDLKEYDGGVTATQFLPFNWLLSCNDYAMLSRVTPLAPLQTEIEITWLVRGDAVEGVDYNVDDVTWLWKNTVEEDVRLCENNQAGVNSRVYRPGPYGEMEKLVEQFIQWYLQQIA